MSEFDTYKHKGHEHRVRQLLDDEARAGLTADYLQRLDLTTSIIESAEHHREWLVLKARQNGASWTEIGRNIGTTKQAAQQRYGKPKQRVGEDSRQISIESELGAQIG